MSRPACLRAIVLAPVALLSLAGAVVAAEPSEPAAPAKQAEQKPADKPNATSKSGSEQKIAQAVPGNGQISVDSQKQVIPSSQGPVTLQKTPAQVKYGLPRNPIVGGVTSLDLNQPLTLAHAIQIGLQQQNSIAIAQTQADAANQRVIQARASYYPQVTPSLTYANSLTPGTVTTFDPVTGLPTSTRNGSFRTDTRTDVIAARQLIFDTGAREANVGLARRSAFAAVYGVGNERQNVVLQVIADYYNVLRDQELVKVQQEAVRRAQTTLDSIKAQVEVGNAAQSDTFQAESDLANAQVSLLLARNNLNIDQANLKNAMGVVTSQQLILADTQVPAPDTKPDSTTLDQYVKTAFVNRLDVKQQQENVNAQGYNVRIAHINNGLTVQANVTEGYQLDPDAGEERQFNVAFSFPLFDGGSTRAAVRETKAVLEQQRRILDQLEQTVRLNVEQSFLTREQARQSIRASQTAVAAGQTNYNAALEKQRNGLINIVDVITAEQQLVTAQVNLVQSIYDFYIADAQLKRDIGLNDPQYVPPVPGYKKALAVPAAQSAKP